MKKTIFLAIAICFAMLSNAQIDLNNGLVAYYPFNGNANDESGNGNNGVVYGASLTTDRFQKSDKAYFFNGIDNSITVPNLSFYNLSAFSFSLWAYSNDTSLERTMYYNGSYLGEWMISSKRFQVKLANGLWYHTNIDIKPNQYNHIVGIYTRGDKLKVYINGEIVNQEPIPDYDLFLETYHQSSIGSYNRGEGYFWNGKLDDIRIYNRALSESEIDILFGSNSSGTISGRIFQDYNASGVFDEEDSLISTGWNIKLEGPVNLTTVSDAEGNYLFEDIPAGTYIISQDVPPDWTVLIPLWSGKHSITLNSGEIISDLDFANFYLQRYNSDMEIISFPNGQKTGENDAQAGSPEAPLQSQPIPRQSFQKPINSIHLNVDYVTGFDLDTIYVDKNSIVQIALSNNNPDYGLTLSHILRFDDPRLTGVVIGVAKDETKMIAFKTYNIERGDIIRYYSGINDCGSGYLIVNNDSDKKKGTINGRIFQDYNATGKFDVGDSIISNGWQISIEGPVNLTTQTDENGYYSFKNLPEGNYVVFESVPKDWTVISPFWSGKYTITLAENQIINNLDFANFHLQRYNSDIEYLQFPNGQNIGKNDDMIGSENAPRQSGFLSYDELPVNCIHLKFGGTKIEPNTIYVNENYITQLAVSSVDQYVHLFAFEDPKFSAVAVLVGPGQTKMITFKTNNVSWGDSIKFYCASPGHNESGEFGYMIVGSAPSSLSLVSPVNNSTITTDNIQFEWVPLPGTSKYELYVDNNSGLGSPEISPQHIDELKNLTSTNYTISGNWLTPGHNYSWKVIAKDASGSIIAESGTGTFSYAPEPVATPTWVPLYRAFQPDVVDHFYCSSPSHLQTAIDKNYRFEGTEGYLALFPFEVDPTNELVPIYRFYQHNEDILKMRCHYYTSDGNDRNNRIIQGWTYEGIIGYGFKHSDIGLVPLHHTYLNVPNTRRDNFYTVSEIEKNNSISLFGYQDIGSICYVSATGENSTMTWLPGSVVAGNGINPFNGNFGNSSKNIFSLPEGNIALNYSHSYNSNSVRLLQSSEPLGVGRNHSYNISLQKTDNSIFVLWGDEFHMYNSQTLSCETPGVYDTLTYIDQNTCRIRKKDQSIFTFQRLGVNNINNTYWLTSISNRHGNTITLEYNSNGWLKHVKSPANRFISFTYYPSSDPHKYGLIRFVKDSLALNRTVEYIYDNQRNLTEFRDVAGKSTFYKYDENYPFDHFLTEITYPDGTKITNTYDVATKRLTNQNFISDNLSTVTSVSLPSAGQVRVTDEMKKFFDIKYNKIGNITELLNAAGDAKYEYTDTLINPTKPTKITDGMGYVTTVTYNSMGDPTQINKPMEVKHYYTWNNLNDIESYTNPMGKTTHFTYNNGKLTNIQSPFGNLSSVNTQFAYFDNGNVRSITDPLGRLTSLTYDGFNNLKTQSDNLENTTTYNYDNASRVISVTDANNNTNTYAYSPDDLLKSTTNPLNHATKYHYDAVGRLTDVEDAKSNKTSMFYQPNTGQLDKIRDQLGNDTYFSYFDNGLLRTKTNRKNQTITFGYDDANRLDSITGPSINRTFTYNDNDLLTQLSDNSGNLTFDYDPLNRLTSHTDYFDKTVTYEYDNANNIIKVGYPGGKSVDYTYYDDGRINTVQDWLGNSTQYLYNLDGSLSRVNNPNGTYTGYTYDDAGRLTGLANKKSDNSVISSYTFVLDGVGNHIEVTATEPLASHIPDAANISYSYNRANHIERAGDITFAHDLNGNMTSQNDNDLITNFTFSAEDMLTGVSGAFSASYQYDGLGFRRSATRDGITTRYVLDASGEMENVLVETNAANQPLYYYIHGNGLLYRIKASDNTVQYYHSDIRGSTIAITDHAQNLTHQYAYDEFGNVSNSLEADFNPFRYVGKYGVMYENEDLYFMRARYYKPSLGRFISEDPVWFANLYVYSNNNPIINIDPDGNVLIALTVTFTVYALANISIKAWENHQKYKIKREKQKWAEEHMKRDNISSQDYEKLILFHKSGIHDIAKDLGALGVDIVSTSLTSFSPNQ